MEIFLVLRNLPGNPMSMTDPIADLLTRIRNAQHGRRTECRASWSKMKQGICDLLKNHGYVADAMVEGEGKDKEVVVVFKTDRPALILARVSKPGARKYSASADIRKILHGNSLAIISTSSGLLTHREAKEKNVGGEVLCTIS